MKTLLALHVSCIALFAAMILLTDLRLLDLAPRGYSVSDMVDQLRVPKRIGFLVCAHVWISDVRHERNITSTSFSASRFCCSLWSRRTRSCFVRALIIAHRIWKAAQGRRCARKWPRPFHSFCGLGSCAPGAESDTFIRRPFPTTLRKRERWHHQPWMRPETFPPPYAVLMASVI